MKKIASLRKGSFALIFSLTFIAGVLLTTILLLANNPPRGWCSKQFSLTTWNVADIQLPWPFVHNYNDIFQISWIKKNSFDNITVLQEDFGADIFNGVGRSYRFGETYGPENHGLSFLSQFNIHDNLFREWSRTSMFSKLDSLAAKGFACAVIYIPVKNLSGWTWRFPIHVYTLHADAGSTWDDQNARGTQFVQLNNFMNGYSKGYSVIVAGDFNLDYSNHTDYEILKQFKTRQQLTMANDPNLITNNEGKTLDYILFRAGDYRESLELTKRTVFKTVLPTSGDPHDRDDPPDRGDTQDWDDPPDRGDTDNMDIKHEVDDCSVVYNTFSDHYPVTAHFKYSVNYDAFPDLVVSDILQVTYDTSSHEGQALVLVKNNGPGATDKETKLHITCEYWYTGPKTREYIIAEEMGTLKPEQISNPELFLGSGTIPQLNRGESVTMDVSLPYLELSFSPYKPTRHIVISATANKPAAFRENDEFNNTLVKTIRIVRH